MKKNSVVKNYIYNLSYQMLVILLPLVTTPYVSRVLGAEGIGSYSYTQSIVQYFILFGCIGLNMYGQKEIAYVQDDKLKRSSIFFELILIRIISVLVSLIVFYFSFVGNQEYHLLFLIQIIDIIASMIDISWFFQGLEDFKKIVLRNFITKIVGVILIFTFVKSSNDLGLYVLLHSLTLFIGNLSMWFYLPKILNKVRIRSLRIVKHIIPTFIMFLPQIATSIYTLLDRTMIGAITGLASEVGFYEQSQRIIKVAMTLVTSLGTVMLPRIANTFANNDHKKIKEYMGNSFSFVFMLGVPIMFGIIGISKGMVPWFFGPGFDKVLPNMIIISPIILIIALSNVIGVQFLLPTNRQKQFTTSVVIGSIVNFSINLLLIPRLYSIGAAIATVIAELCVTLYQMYTVRNVFSLKFILNKSFKYCVSGIVMLFCVLTLSTFLEISILSTLVEIMFGAIVYLVCLIVLKDEIIIRTINSVRKKIFK